MKAKRIRNQEERERQFFYSLSLPLRLLPVSPQSRNCISCIPPAFSKSACRQGNSLADPCRIRLARLQRQSGLSDLGVQLRRSQLVRDVLLKPRLAERLSNLSQVLADRYRIRARCPRLFQRQGSRTTSREARKTRPPTVCRRA